ncbi:hypothetical protein HYU19_06030 [Candidatus Woesearchaeota archaeon]|nr:hypothetical protein [Candidatus Woesearchaeota archaeon]
MLNVNEVLLYYRRPEIQKAMVAGAVGKEVAVKYGESGFGKRPDTLSFPNDVWELAKQGATSFHASEEVWTNPLSLDVGLRRQELDALRKGWDLVLDIDCPSWPISKLTAWLLVKSLQEHQLSSISIKFSGNKGFHIGVPFESFPSTFQGKPTAQLFPEAPRKIAAYLVDYLSKKHIAFKDNKLVFGKTHSLSFDKLMEATGKAEQELLKKACRRCAKPIPASTAAKTEFVCASCEVSMAVDNDPSFFQCPSCSRLMEKMSSAASLCPCGSNEYDTVFNHTAVFEVDTILISPRHLYRSVYSLHEKSGLASIPFDPSAILSFKKDSAAPAGVVPGAYVFLDRSTAHPGEAGMLLSMAYDYALAKEQANPARPAAGSGAVVSEKEFEQFQQAAPVELFPPCMHNILKGLQDGKKRGLFLLVNFLSSVGWDPDKIEAFLHEWNKKNPEPLREVIIQGKMRYQRQLHKSMLPPNCDNQMYYVGIGVCAPDGLCAKIKNPVQYVRRKMYYLQHPDGGKKAKQELTPEEKAVREQEKQKRKEFRESVKKAKESGAQVESVEGQPALP